MSLLLESYTDLRFYRWSAKAGWLLLLVAMQVVINPMSAQKLQLQDDQPTLQKETGICQSVDIRNTLETFKLLEGCRVVEGFVQILLFDNVNESLYDNITFPELVEITDYLLLYRVNGLRTLGNLFPNLSVIRGQNAFYNYAFVLFEMSSLQEIGLYSLTDITHGLVRIDKNPNLCFVNTIDWELIAHEKGEHFIKSNKLENECPMCPNNDNNHSGSSNTTSCTLSSRKSNQGLCWNQEHCQKLCPKECNGTCINGKCCDNSCLGGCLEDNIYNCTVCRHFSIGSLNDKKCIQNCPAGYYEYIGRRCVTKEECQRMRRPINSQQYQKITSEFPYKPFEKKCRLHCPVGYMEDSEHQTCKQCQGSCKKECDGASIDSIQSAEQLNGCTHIKGSIEIQIRGGRNIVNELEQNLQSIEEISGYLKIVRSFPLVSLNFLKNLRVIHGEHLDNSKYVFVVLDNQNLQELWDWDALPKGRSLKIKRGKLFFHFNPKLCFYKILKLKEIAKMSDFSDSEVAPNSNGDKVACNVTTMEVRQLEIKSTGVLLSWNQFIMEDPRSLLGYVLYSIEDPHGNITLYDGRDACGGDGWRVDDVENPTDTSVPIFHILTQLKPYTQYAYYVKTYTIATERSGAQSPIYYLRTKPDRPSGPQNVQVIPHNSDALYIKWQPPLLPNGNVTHYIISGIQQVYSKDLLNRRNYCNEPLTNTPIESKVPDIQVEATTMKSNIDRSCPCEDNSGYSNPYKENEILSQINFEDELHNQVYIKRDDGRGKRDINNGYKTFPNSNTTYNALTTPISIGNKTNEYNNNWEKFTFKVYNKTEFLVTQLQHFSVYNIYIQACREIEPDDDLPHCSAQGLNSQKTAKKAGADNIKGAPVAQLPLSNNSSGTVTLSWTEPTDPNGLILTYSIEYRRLDIENSKALVECIKRQDFEANARSYTLKSLTAGNYSLRVMATSLAGNGEYSEYAHILIEENRNNTTIAITAILCVLILVALVLVAYFVYRRVQPQGPSMKLITTVNPEYVSTIYVPDDWEVPRKKIELLRELGQGSFGMVYEGVARDIKGKAEIRCAIKTVNEHATDRERIEFLNEASVMKAFDTTHVVRLLGVVSQGQPTLVVMELMANGDLKSYLRSHRPDAESYNPSSSRQPPTLKRILQMAIEIADGMAYLSAKKFVHRDLAARNCMVADDLTVKIGDFGMTRDIYETDYYRKGTKGLLPVRWMAPESLKDGVFTSSSDVWSYGVVLWEMATLASQPYQGLSNDQVLRYVIDGGIMERPENCPDKLYQLMRCCWQHKPSTRPNFLDLGTQLLDDAHPSFEHVSFYHSPAGVEARLAHATPSQDDPSTPLRSARSDMDEDFSLGSSDPESEMELESDTIRNESRMEFPVLYQGVKEDSSTANGYVSGRPTNGTATTQC